MFKPKISQNFLTILGVIGFGLPIALTLVSRGQAQSGAQSSGVTQQVTAQTQAEKFEPPNRGAPYRTADGGARGCQEDTLLTVTPLIPSDRGATTVSEHPTFLWYWNSQTGVKVKELNFILLTHDQEEEIYVANQLPVNQSGIVSLQIPKTQPPLENGKWYEWFLQVQVEKDGQDISNCYISAWIQRQALTPDRQLELDSLSTAESRWDFYSQHDIWYDALATLNQLRQENPTDKTLDEKWRKALASIELSELAEQPLTETTQIVRGQQNEQQREQQNEQQREQQREQQTP